MPDNRQLEILADLLKTAERNFEAAAKHAATIDDKAQKTSALAGVIVAFGFIKPEGLNLLQENFGPSAPALLYGTLVLLIVAVTFCLRAMWLRKVPVGGISLLAHEKSARIVIGFGAEIDDELLAAYRENQLEVWKQVISERHQANVQKTRLVHNAQRVLALAIMIAVATLGLLGYVSLGVGVPLNQELRMPKKEENPPAREKLIEIQNSDQAGFEKAAEVLVNGNGAREAESTEIDDHESVAIFYSTRFTPRQGTRLAALNRLRSSALVAEQTELLDRLE